MIADFAKPIQRAWGRSVLLFLTLTLSGFLCLTSSLTAADPGKAVTAESHLRAARQALERRDFAGAREHLKQYVKVHPDSADAHYLWARAARRASAYEEAKDHLRECRRLKGRADAIELEWKLQQVQAGELEDEVLKFLKACVKENHPDAVLILEALSQGYMENSLYASALDSLNEWLKRRPKDIQALLWRGEVKERMPSSIQGGWRAEYPNTNGLPDYRRAVEIDPNHDEACLGLAERLVLTSEPKEALKHFERLCKRLPKNPAVLLGLARCRHQLGELEEAQQLLDDLLKEHPRHTSALAERARLALINQQPAEAERWLRQAVALAPWDREANYLLYNCLLHLGKEEEATRYLDRMNQIESDLHRMEKLAEQISKAPKDPSFRYQAGVLLLRQGKEKEGLRVLERALKLDPQHRPTHQALADYYERTGNKERANQHRRLAQPAEKPQPERKDSNLRPPVYQPLPLGSIRPTGWLRKQLRIQADGLSGHLDEMWPDVKNSAWAGGTGDGWERGPYWLDGVVPLAFLLDDAKLKAKVQRWMDYILTHQQEDGWLGPAQAKNVNNLKPTYDVWPITILLKALTQYEEATHDPRVIPALQKCLHKIDGVLNDKPLTAWKEGEDWARYRWADLVLSIHWLYNHTHEAWLLDLAAKVHRQGFDWRAHYAKFRDTDKTTQPRMWTHGVNTAMGLKAPAVWSRQSGDAGDRDAVWHLIETLDTYHGQATGMFTCDEHLAGLNPSQGSELCTVVEYMFSLETAAAILGDSRFGDRLEQIAFNALPGTCKADMCAHQYDQQANQVVCKICKERIYVDNGPDANIYGLEPNFGCCTANMHQGWPKLASHLWMQTPAGGLFALAYAPCSLDTKLAGKPVRIDVQTDYPFDETVTLVVTVPEALRFPLDLRIPAWADGAEVRIANEQALPAKPGTLHGIEREWTGRTTVRLRLPMTSRVRRGYHRSVSIQRGPLVFALKVGTEWKLLKGKPPFADWEVHPTTPWNYALELDVDHPEKTMQFEKRGVGDTPFSPDGAPILAKVKGRRLPQWKLEKNAAGPLPPSPVESNEPLEDLVLIPYGCTSLRVTEFPLLGQR